MSVGGIGGGSNVGGVGPTDRGDPGDPSTQVALMQNTLDDIANAINGGDWGAVVTDINQLCSLWNSMTQNNQWGPNYTPEEQDIRNICFQLCSTSNPTQLGIISRHQDPSGNWIITPADPNGAPGTTWWNPSNTPRIGDNDPDANTFIVNEIVFSRGEDPQVFAMTNELWDIASDISQGDFGPIADLVKQLAANCNARTNSNSWGHPPTPQEAKILKVISELSSVTDASGTVKTLGIISSSTNSQGYPTITPADPNGASGTSWWNPGNTPRVGDGDPDPNTYIVQLINTILPHSPPSKSI